MTESCAAVAGGAALPRQAVAFWPRGTARLCQLARAAQSAASTRRTEEHPEEPYGSSP